MQEPLIQSTLYFKRNIIITLSRNKVPSKASLPVNNNLWFLLRAKIGQYILRHPHDRKHFIPAILVHTFHHSFTSRWLQRIGKSIVTGRVKEREREMNPGRSFNEMVYSIADFSRVLGRVCKSGWMDG